MLTLRAPIKTVLNPELTSASEAFANRILGNYRQIGIELGQTDLLHVTNEPPEIFVMDGGMTNLFSASNVENTQIQKTQIINNLINRIVLSADAGFSYQDNVYVTNILHKLGIKDEKTFLREVERMFTETREHHEAVQLYWENMESLRSLIREYRKEEHTLQTTEEKAVEQPVLHLHEEVNRRLQTAAIYRVLQNFFESATEPRILTNEVMRISEQNRVSREILLSRLREEVRMEPAYLTYRHENYYEGDEVSENEITVESVSSRISSAVLLNLIDNIYDNVYRRVDHHLDNWLSTESTYYGAAENTLFRIEQNTAYLQYLYEQEHNMEERSITYGDEITMLHQLIDMYQQNHQRVQQSLGGNTYETDMEAISNFIHVDGDTTLTEVAPMELNFVTNEGEEGDTITNIRQGDSLQEAVDKIYQQSIVRNQQYMNALQKIVEQGQPVESSNQRLERMQQESRMALEHPEVFLQEYQRADEIAKEEAQRLFMESEKLLSPEQQVAHQLIREYLQAPQNFYNSTLISEGNMGVMLYDIHEASMAAESYGKDSGEASGTVEGAGSSAGVEDVGKPTEEIIEVPKHHFYGVDHIFEKETLREREFADVQEHFSRESREHMILHRETELIHQMTERIIERWQERRERPYGPDVTYEDIRTAMVHRSKEMAIDEEVIESMQQQIRRMEETQQNVTERTQMTETENRTVINNIVNETIEHNTQAITDMVNSTVRKQLDDISDRVYGKIEKQLKNERRRRGL